MNNWEMFKNFFKFFQARFLVPGYLCFVVFCYPSSASAQCTWNLNSGQACTFVQGTSTDNCTTSNSTPSTEAMNQFYAYGASGVSVLFCSGTSNTVSNGSLVTMACAPPAGATIVKAFLDVVEYNGSSSSPTASLGAVNFNGGLTGAGTLAGLGNLWNVFDDPRYGYDVASYPNQTAFNVRYDVTSRVANGTASYNVSYPNIGSNTVWSASLVVVYTVPAAGVCGGVAITDGLFYWDKGHDDSGSAPALREGVTPYAPTVDWS
ncbi:MAG TPA: hypothetical protein VMV05_01125, partial [bacterium]|nr:hypothetical protein [bacterium]